VKRKLVTLLSAGSLLAAAPPAAANTVNSANWAGYAVHRTGVSFTKVVGAWRAPRPKCGRDAHTYSAVWVGLGGYSTSAQALEQVGTEADCNGTNHPVLSAWYEQVPQPSHPVRLRVRPGDSLVASVAVAGQQVRLVLTNRTRHTSFVKTMTASLVDVSSAEWIVEAPSECVAIDVCRTLPLANFGTTRFTRAYVHSTIGHAGTISNAGWSATRIRLTPSGHPFAVDASGPAGGAVPSSLINRGSAFAVRYARTAAAARAAAASADIRLFRPGRWWPSPGWG
jgi:Peptidase A4 family